MPPLSESYPFPKLRWPLDLKIEHINNQDVFIIRCPMGLSQPLALIAEVAPIVACMDGSLSFDEVLKRFAPFGLTAEILQQLLELVDEYLFLDGPKFTAAYQKVKDDFASSRVRPAALAGAGYPQDRRTLEQQIDAYLKIESGSAADGPGSMAALLSPHIDYRRGSACYGLTYQALKNQKHDLYVLMGTSHQYSPHMFHLTTKDFQSPLGVLACDRELTDELAQLYGRERSFADELLHRSEHALELQLPFLQRLQAAPVILPILVGGFQHIISSGRSPENFEEYESFAAALTLCLQKRITSGKTICFVAGVDLAHIGRSFGDAGNLTPDGMARIAARDQEFLQAVAAQDKKAVFAHVAEDRDARRICGFPTIYTLVDVLGRLGLRCRARILDYRQAVDYQSDCAVTFAGVGLYSV